MQQCEILKPSLPSRVPVQVFWWGEIKEKKKESRAVMTEVRAASDNSDAKKKFFGFSSKRKHEKLW